jgi:hypothetical protein
MRTSALAAPKMGRPIEERPRFQTGSPDLENSSVRDYRGDAGNVSHGGTVNPACNRKSRNGHPHT